MREFKVVLCKFICPAVSKAELHQGGGINNAFQRKEERPCASGCQNKIVTCPLMKDQPIQTPSNYNHTELSHHKNSGLHTFPYSVSKNQVNSRSGKRSAIW